MIKLLTINFLRSRGTITGLVFLVVFGLISLNIGKHFLDKNQQIIDHNIAYQQKNIDQHLKHASHDIGLLLYYLRFGIANETPNLTGLSIGLRDINPAVHSVTIRNLEEQKYTQELFNPMYQLLGNMDFSFVLIYFFPLIIIALCFNVISEEKEQGTWKLLAIQSDHPSKIVLAKIGIRYISVLTILAFLLIIAKFYLAIPLNASFLCFILMAVLYTSFWFALTYLMISFNKSSSQNALWLLTSWMILTIIVPASVNAIIINSYPIPEAFSTIIENREGYHNKWDQSIEPTIQKFKMHYPQFSEFKHPEGANFSWLWYYAMQQMGDDESVNKSRLLKKKIRARTKLSSQIGMLFPTIHTQLAFNALSHSNMADYLSFIEGLEEFHEQKRLYFYPKIFKADTNEDWETYKLEFFNDDQPIHWVDMLMPLIIMSLACLAGASTNFNKNANSDSYYHVAS